MNNRPNLILIVLDTLRKDTLEDNLANLPNLRHLIEESTYYQNAVSPASWTIPSHASMFTGLYPSEHMMTSAFDDDSFFKAISSFPAKASPIQEVLKRKGYCTSSLSANSVVGKDTAFSTGFESVETIGPFQIVEEYSNEIKDLIGKPKRSSLEGITGNKTKFGFIRTIGLGKTLKVAGLLRKKKRELDRINFPVEKGAKQLLEKFVSIDLEEPYFVFLNLMEMHEPYQGVPDLEEIAKVYLKGMLSDDHSGSKRYEKSVTGVKSRLIEDLIFVDRFLGRLISYLKEQRRYENTMVVIASDHGQSLGEDNYVGHGYLLNDVLVNVPLIVKHAGNRGKCIETSFTSLTGIYELLMSSGEGKTKLTVPDYVFSEEFGLNESVWRYRLDDYSSRYKPEIRKRIWSQQGYTLGVNGTQGVIEEFQFKGRKLAISDNKEMVEDLVSELELFTGNSKFNFPTHY